MLTTIPQKILTEVALNIVIKAFLTRFFTRFLTRSFRLFLDILRTIKDFHLQKRMSKVISKIFREAREKDMPMSAPGIALFSLQASTPDKFDSSKAYRYKTPYFTEVKLLTHDQLERINKIIEEKHPKSEYSNYTKKDVSIMDLSKISQKETVKIVGEFPKLGDEKPQKDLSKKSLKNVFKKTIKNSQEKQLTEEPRKTIVEISHKKLAEDCQKECCEECHESICEDVAKKPLEKPQKVPHKMTKKDKLLKHKNCH